MRTVPLPSSCIGTAACIIFCGSPFLLLEFVPLFSQSFLLFWLCCLSLSAPFVPCRVLLFSSNILFSIVAVFPSAAVSVVVFYLSIVLLLCMSSSPPIPPPPFFLFVFVCLCVCVCVCVGLNWSCHYIPAAQSIVYQPFHSTCNVVSSVF